MCTPTFAREDVLTCILRGELDDFQNGRRVGGFRGRSALPSRFARAETRATARADRRTWYTLSKPLPDPPPETTSLTPGLQSPLCLAATTLPYILLCLAPEVSGCWMAFLALLSVFNVVRTFFVPTTASDTETAGQGPPTKHEWINPTAFRAHPEKGNTPPHRTRAFVPRQRMGSVYEIPENGPGVVTEITPVNKSFLKSTSVYAFVAMFPYVAPVAPDLLVGCSVLLGLAIL